jgi:hypothetical protein
MICYEPQSAHNDEIFAEQVDGFRYYSIPYGTGRVWVPSVTTVTGYTNKEFFKEWRKDPANEKKLDAAINRGNAVHDACELYLKGESYEHLLLDCPTHKQCFKAIQNVLNRSVGKVIALEEPLYSVEHKFAGRVDCVAEFDGVLSIIDFKNTEKPKRSYWIQNYFQQATAYSIAWEELTGQPIKQFVILVGHADGMKCQVFREPTVHYKQDLYTCIKDFWKSHLPTYKQHLEQLKGYTP